MTCVLSPTSISSFTALPSMRWSPMTSTADLSSHGNVALPSTSSSYGDSPTGSVTYKKAGNGHVKKRASRAGTRSVSTLSATQLERKRANDREAQRAIRQRTKDHIDGLEKTLSDIKQTLEGREKLLNAAHQRNRELEDENAMLRLRLEGTSNAVPLPAKFARPSDAGLNSAPPSAVSEASGSMSQRSGSISHGYTLGNGVMNGTWQQPGFQAANGNLMLSTNTDAQARSMTGWRAREGAQNSNSLQGVHPPQAIPYTPTGAEDRSSWPSQYDFNVPPTPTAQHFAQQATTAQQTDHQFAQNTSGAYQGGQQQQDQAFHPPLLPPNDFQAMSNRAFFQQFAPQSQSFQTQPQYGQANTVQTANANYAGAQVQASPVAPTQYHNGSADQAFSQQIHPPMQFRDEAELRNYSIPQYPSG